MSQCTVISQPGNVNASNRSARHKKSARCNFVIRSSSGHVRQYIASLHRRIRNLMEKCRKYRAKVAKLERAFRRTKIATDDTTPTNASQAESDTTKPTEPTMSTDNFINDIKNAALDAQNLTGFIYEPTSGLYYDSRTGYYYNAEHGLYYDGDRGCYYSYDQAENKFKFHSQVYTGDDTTTSKEAQAENSKKSSKSDGKQKDVKKQTDSGKKQQKLKDNDECDEAKEDGELSDDFEDDDDDDDTVTESVIQSPPRLYRTRYFDTGDENSSSAFSDSDKYSDIARNYPPSLRIIVQETNTKKLKLGELFLITYKGGSLGREGDHDVIIPDLVCSKFHLKFAYDIQLQSYTCTDLGSRNGTILNGQRMSNSKQESDALKLDHGSIIQIGQNKLLCHIHDGSMTCGQCEPGLVQQDSGASTSYDSATKSSSHGQQSHSQGTHKQQLKELKKRYGLQDNTYEAVKMNPKNDRAEHRRQKVGSSCEYEKTKSASLTTPIASDNKGFKMLSKLGWNAGQSLGKNSDGVLEPIAVESNPNQKGLGSEKIVSTASYSQHDSKQNRKSKILKKTSERYKASQVTDIFEDCNNE